MLLWQGEEVVGDKEKEEDFYDEELCTKAENHFFELIEQEKQNWHTPELNFDDIPNKVSSSLLKSSYLLIPDLLETVWINNGSQNSEVKHFSAGQDLWNMCSQSPLKNCSSACLFYVFF